MREGKFALLCVVGSVADKLLLYATFEILHVFIDFEFV